jgi:hypothetical protein
VQGLGMAMFGAWLQKFLIIEPFFWMKIKLN